MTQTETIRLPNRFDFSQHQQFTSECERCLSTPNLASIVIDCSQVKYLDSSALGMLVMLAKKAAGHQVPVTLAGAQGVAKDILAMANMNKLFLMSESHGIAKPAQSTDC